MLLRQTLASTAKLRQVAADGRIPPQDAAALSSAIEAVQSRTQTLRVLRERLMAMAIARHGTQITPCSMRPWGRCYTIEAGELWLWYNAPGDYTYTVQLPLPAGMSV